jgi:hypothetical protein
LHAPVQTTEKRKTAPRRWIGEIPSDYPAILASVMPIVTPRRVALDGRKENNEKTVDSDRPSPRRAWRAVFIRSLSGRPPGAAINSRS